MPLNSLPMDDTRFSLPRIAVVRSSSSGHSHERRPSEVPLLEESQLGVEKQQQYGRPPTPSKEGPSRVRYAPSSQEEDETRARSSESLPHVERGPIIRRTGNRDSITRLLHESLTQTVNGRRRRLIPGFEPPSYLSLVLLAVLCALAYAILVLVSALADKESIFWARFIVAAGCTLSGLSISTVLLLMARKVLEAAAWATVIHQSRLNGSPGIRLKDFDAHSYAPMLVWPALRLLWDRWVYPGAARKERTHYDRHAWSLHVLLFVLSCVVAAWTPFALGRTVLIEPSALPQQRRFQEVPVLGPLSEIELDSMNQLAPMMMDEALRWTLGPWGSSSPTLSFEWANYPMHLPEVRWDQVADWLRSEPASSTATLRYPRWGVRVRCASSKDAAVSIVPNARSNVSYVFTPRGVVRKLFGDLQVPFPAQLQRHPNWTEVMNGGDLLPAGLDLMSTALAERFPHDGNSFSLKNYAMDADPSWQGFASVETTLVRLNASFAPQGRFTRVTTPPQGEVLDGSGRPTYIGYDASVCLLAYEPWMMEVHHRGSGFLETRKCLGRGARVEDFDPAIQRQERVGPEWKGNNSEGWDVRRPAFTVAHQNAVTNMAKGANGGQGPYTPSSMIVSFTNGGNGPYNYTSLSGEAYAHRRALAASAFTLPHLLGSSTQLARRYLDDQVSSTSLSHGALGIVIGSLLALGMILTFFVPSLPGNWPRRGFDLHSWFVAMQTGEIVASRGDVIMQKGMDLSDPNIVRPLGQMRLRFIEGYGRT